MDVVSAVDHTSGYWTVIRSDLVRKSKNFSSLNEQTEYVHISGSPHAWIVKAIIDNAPNLKMLQINRVFEGTDISKRTERACRRKKINVAYGSVLVGTREDRNQVSVRYRQQRAFFQALPVEKRLEIKELCRLGLREALLTSRYFCLEGEEYIQIGEVAQDVFGEKKRVEVSACLYAFMKYFQPMMEVKPHIACIYKRMMARLNKLRAAEGGKNRVYSATKAGRACGYGAEPHRSM